MANCIKCGKELTVTKVFCEECLEVMERYPVPSTAHVTLYPREPAAQKAPGKKKLSPEEQVTKLKRLTRQLTAALVVLALLLGAGLFWLIREIREPGVPVVETKGQNYSIQPGESLFPAQSRP